MIRTNAPTGTDPAISAARRRLSALPSDFAERVYAGVLGKIIGVYLGRPIEAWSHERIDRELGEIWYYVSERLGQPLVITDDDITGTFTFVRAIEDAGYDPGITSEQIGRTWLDYLIEDRTILWWSGLGNSTEHTAYLRLKAGIPAPASGSAELNGQVVAEQIGGQIFIDAWAMLHPGDPEQAADLARRAASVSHDGVAVHAAQVIAAMEAQAFVETDVGSLLDVGVAQIPRDSLVRRLIHELRDQRAGHDDWRRARSWLANTYGYDRYGGNVHVIPNHGLIVLALLFGDGDFQRSLMIVNSAGWDTDCNSGNLGCLLGIMGGLDAIDRGPDWRGPLADRLFLPTADGGRAITDAVQVADGLVTVARRMRGLPDVRPKDGARFHFTYPGSVQGFAPDRTDDVTNVRVSNSVDPSLSTSRGLAVRWTHLAPRRVVRILTPTFLTDPGADMGTYELIACPTLYPGQEVRAVARLPAADSPHSTVRLVVRHYGPGDAQMLLRGPDARVEPGSDTEIAWKIPDIGGHPISAVGIEIADGPATGELFLDRLTWTGAPEVRFTDPRDGGTMWRRAWVDAVDDWSTDFPEAYRIMQDAGFGLVSQGTSGWRDYTARARLRLHMGRSGGLAVRVQGRGRWYGLLLVRDGSVRLVRTDHTPTVLASRDLGLDPATLHDLELVAVGDRVVASLDGEVVFDLVDRGTAIRGGGVALVVEEGRLESDLVEVGPVGRLST